MPKSDAAQKSFPISAKFLDSFMFIGVFYGIAACMIWGFVYLVPLVLPQYDPAYIAAGRFVSFGLLAGPLVWLERNELRCYTLADWIYVAKLGVIGNIVYFWCLTYCIQYAGAPFAGMCMSLVPVLVALVSNFKSRRKGRGLPLAKLAPGLILILAGMVTANITEFKLVVEASLDGSSRFWFGVFMGVLALLTWTWYPIRNAEWLLAHPERSARTWSTAQGLTTLPFAVIFYLLVWSFDEPGRALLGPDPWWFVFVVAASGIICSWLGIVLWNAMSQRLPTALGGQLIVFETIFAVIYAHALRAAWPEPTMTAGLALLLAGVLLSLRAFRRQW